jgi:peptidylprolyl isomerase
MILRRIAIGLATFALLFAGGRAAHAADDPTAAIVGLDHAVTTASGLRYIDQKPGEGAPAKPGDGVSVQYTGWLFEDGHKGMKFDSSYDRNEPFSFVLASHQVIPGWDEGVAGMQPGGRRLLIIPPELAYGDRGAGGVIPPGATLVFEIRLLDIKSGSSPAGD